MMKKKMLLTLAAIAGIVSLLAGVGASTLIHKIDAQLREDFTIVIDGETKVFKNVDGETVYPILYNGTTYLPVRAIGEMMGKRVYWYENAKRVELVDKKSTVTDADVIVHESVGTVDANELIGVEKAKEIALDAAGMKAADVTFTKEKLDRDDGVLYYEIKFKTKTAKYEFEINALNGKITDRDVDRKDYATTSTEKAKITAETAKKIALEKAGLTAEKVIFEEVELDFDDGVLQYELEFKSGKTEYEADINAIDGTIIEWKVDKDD